MKSPEEYYMEGYSEGCRNTLGDQMAHASFGYLRDDPHGHYAAGYRDAAAGHPIRIPAPTPTPKAEELNPFDEATAVRVACPRCGLTEWIRWKFLGKLGHAGCGYTWYARPSLYLRMQIRASFSAARKGIRYFNSGSTSGQGAWIASALGWFMGATFGFGFRFTYGLAMMPFQAIAGLLDSSDSQGSNVRIERFVILGVFLVVVIGWIAALNK